MSCASIDAFYAFMMMHELFKGMKYERRASINEMLRIIDGGDVWKMRTNTFFNL